MENPFYCYGDPKCNRIIEANYITNPFKEWPVVFAPQIMKRPTVCRDDASESGRHGTGNQ